MESLKISFDFDNTLDQQPIQELCKKFIELGAEVFIVTSRTDKMTSGIKLNNKEVFLLADKLGIKKDHIIFTSFQDKYGYVKEFDIHIDDDFEEIFLINEGPFKTFGFLYEDKTNFSKF